MGNFLTNLYANHKLNIILKEMTKIIVHCTVDKLTAKIIYIILNTSDFKCIQVNEVRYILIQCITSNRKGFGCSFYAVVKCVLIALFFT